jgi:hypothetical protein
MEELIFKSDGPFGKMEEGVKKGIDEYFSLPEEERQTRVIETVQKLREQREKGQEPEEETRFIDAGILFSDWFYRLAEKKNSDGD